MTLKTIAGQDYEDMCIFQSDNGNIYVAMRFYEVHDIALYDVDVTDIFEGYCKAFKFPGWEDYDYHNERGVLFMVHKSLGSAKQWMGYSDMCGASLTKPRA